MAGTRGRETNACILSHLTGATPPLGVGGGVVSGRPAVSVPVWEK